VWLVCLRCEISQPRHVGITDDDIVSIFNSHISVASFRISQNYSVDVTLVPFLDIARVPYRPIRPLIQGPTYCQHHPREPNTPESLLYFYVSYNDNSNKDKVVPVL
jgi:hypothetical protein